MPIHDWSRVDAGTFHAFHTAWITHLSEALNNGLLPDGYYALPEQHGGRMIADVLTLQIPSRPNTPSEFHVGGTAVADHPPQVQRFTLTPAARGIRRTLAIRHVSGNRVIAILEIVSPGNRDRASHVKGFVDKVVGALWQGVSVLIVDLFRPSAHEPWGMHGAVWEHFDDLSQTPADINSVTLASYVPPPELQAYVENLQYDVELIEMPLFLNAERYINVPLQTTYDAAFRGLPKYVRDLLTR